MIQSACVVLLFVMLLCKFRETTGTLSDICITHALCIIHYCIYKSKISSSKQGTNFQGIVVECIRIWVVIIVSCFDGTYVMLLSLVTIEHVSSFIKLIHGYCFF